MRLSLRGIGLMKTIGFQIEHQSSTGIMQIKGEHVLEVCLTKCYHHWRDDKSKWYDSIYMPKEACRLLLRITDISRELLQEINQENAQAKTWEVNHTGKLITVY